MPKMIEHACYAVKTDDKSESAELIFYGNVVKKRPLEWDGECIKKSEDNFIVEKEFLNDLDAISKCKKLNIRVNSLGGDVHVALNIYSRLREFADNGTELTCSVDGVAMSAGSIIMCAADKVKVNDSSLIMIHRCMVRYDGYLNADELRKQAEIQDEYDKVIASCYRRKTGRSESELLKMMSRETYMTAAEAKDKGFADVFVSSGDALEIAACADKKSLLIGGRVFDLMGAPLPENLPTVTLPELKNSGEGVTHIKTTEGGNKIMASNFDELLKENPELAAAIEKEIRAKAETDNKAISEKAAEEERKRIAEIDKIANQCSPELVTEAKYGEKTCSAQELAYRMLLENEQKGRSYLNSALEDTNNSNVGNVQAAPDVTSQGQNDVKSKGLSFMDSVLSEKEEK